MENLQPLPTGDDGDGFYIGHLDRVQLDPGDVLIVNIAPGYSINEMEPLMDRLKQAFPDNKIIMSQMDMEMYVLRKGKILAGVKNEN